MGLRTPQDLLRTNTAKPTPSLNVKAGGASKISNDFLNVTSNILSAKAKADAERNKAKQDFINTSLANDLDTLRVQAEADLSNNKGVNALQETSNIKNDYLAKINSRLDKVPSEYRRTYDVQTTIQKSTGKFDRFAIGYASSEARKVEDDTYTARVSNDINNIVENAGNIEYIKNEGIATLEQSVANKLSKVYGNDLNKELSPGVTAGDLIAAEQETAVSDAIRKSINQQLMVDRFDLAQETLTNLYDRLTPSDREKVLKRIETETKTKEDTQSLALAEEAWKMSEGNLVQAEQIILSRSAGNGDQYKKALSFVQTKSSIVQKQKDKDNENRFNDLYDQMEKTGNININEFKKLPAEDRQKFRDAAFKNKGGGAVITDPQALRSANDRMNAMTDEEIVGMDINKMYKHSISPQDREILLTRQRYVQKQVSSQYSHGQRWNPGIVKSATANFTKALGIYPKSAKAAELEWMIEDLYGQIITENPKIKEQEIRTMLNRQIRDKTQVEVKTTGAFAKIGQSLGFDIEDTYETKYNIPEDATFRNKRDVDIDSSWVRKVQSSRAQAGKKPYTEDQLNAFAKYLQERNKEIDLTKPLP